MYKHILYIFFAAAVSLTANAQTELLRFALPEKMPAAVNSTAEESLPIVSPDGSTLYFTRTFHPENEGGKTGGQDIWQSISAGTGWQKATNATGLNNAANNALAGVARGGKRIYLLNQVLSKKKNNPGLSYCDWDEVKKTWGPQQSVTVPELEVTGHYYSAWVSADERFIFWSLPGVEAAATNDLYISTSNDGGNTWTAPRWLGNMVNTGMNEISPYFDQSLKVLFFASDGHAGFGGYDIFYSRPLDDSYTLWSLPENAGSSINSDKFDAYLISMPDSTLYFSSNRSDTLSALYISRLMPAEEMSTEEETSDSSVVAESPIKMPNPELIIEKQGAEGVKDIKLSTLTREELLDERTRIRFVYFPYKRYQITPKYIEVLDDVANILDKYPDLYVLIDGHTDAIGSQAYNLVLSENRAQSAREYLLIHGVDDGRIKTKSWGKIQPYATNLTDEGRALNRRVEITFGVVNEPKR